MLYYYLEFICEDYKKLGGMVIHIYLVIKYVDDCDVLLVGLMDGCLVTMVMDEYMIFKGFKLFGDIIEIVCGGYNGIEICVLVVFIKFVIECNMLF